MKRVKLSRKDQEVTRLLKETQTLKQVAEARRREIEAIEAALEQFEAQYDIYIQTLQRRREDLAGRVRQYRLLIQQAEKPEEPPPPRDPEPLPAPAPDLSPEEPPESPPLMADIQPSDTLLEQKRKGVRNFFAQFWHPDAAQRWSGARPDLHLMHRLNAAFEQSEDVVDLLIAIPLHDVWWQAGQNEKIGAQWARLMDWQEWLEEAGQRLDRRLAEVQQSEFYPLLLEKQQADEQDEDYFARLAFQERDEINRLEQTLQTLQTQLDDLQPRQAQDPAHE